jgi:hypothetical protein
MPKQSRWWGSIVLMIDAIGKETNEREKAETTIETHKEKNISLLSLHCNFVLNTEYVDHFNDGKPSIVSKTLARSASCRCVRVGGCKSRCGHGGRW